MRTVFDSFNLQAAATQGNSSGVYFSLTYSTGTMAEIDPDSGQSANVGGVSNGLQVNRSSTLGPTRLGNTTRGVNDAGTP